MTGREEEHSSGLHPDIESQLEALTAIASKLPELLRILEYENLGRVVRLVHYGDSDMPDWQEKLGIILPLNKENTLHYWILRSGEMFVTRPYPANKRGEAGYSLQEYKDFLSPSKSSYDIEANEVWIDKERNTANAMMSIHDVVQITHTNTGEKDLPVLAKAWPIALLRSYELHEERERARDRSVVTLFDSLTIFLAAHKPGKEPPSAQPPLAA